MSRTRVFSSACAILLALAPAAPGAADPSLVRAEAVTLRLVLGAPAADGSGLSGAVLVDLAPGWKTYWLDPGEAGLPPRITLSAAGAPLEVDIRLPAPRRLGEGAARINGYEGSTAVAFTLESPIAPGTSVAADLLVGVCRDICVPVSARLEARAEAEPPLADRRAVRAAFADLPQSLEPGTVRAGEQSGEDGAMLRVEATLPPDAQAGGGLDAFVTAAGGWRFGEPASALFEGSRAVFDVPVLRRPTGEAAALPAAVDVLVTGEDLGLAVENVPVR